ncbi:MAG TPA: site-2 protease family protein [candidate division Zixibacteria bacterium]|nr:site-2 protease family protein [candidate division Zixibacteria bacterium]
MQQRYIEIFYQIMAFLFALSFHESAHAWVANRCGDPTGRMLGRISLNPIRHIDPVGTVLMPIIAAITHVPLIGWAKPVPVNPLNFRDMRRDDILVSLAGPVSNMILAVASSLVLVCLRFATGLPLILLANNEGSVWQPITIMMFTLLEVNLLLAVFNCIPIPPLDGSHVLRHMLPSGMQETFDRVGMFGLIIVMMVGGRLLSAMLAPVENFFYGILFRI